MGRIRRQDDDSFVRAPGGEQGNIVNASKFGIYFQMGSHYDINAEYYPLGFPILSADASSATDGNFLQRPAQFMVDKRGGNPDGVTELSETDSALLDYRRSAYDFDKGSAIPTSEKRPVLYFEHTS